MFLLTELSDACAAVLGVSLEELWASWREYCHLSLRHRQTRVAVEARLQQQPAGPSAEAQQAAADLEQAEKVCAGERREREDREIRERGRCGGCVGWGRTVRNVGPTSSRRRRCAGCGGSIG